MSSTVPVSSISRQRPPKFMDFELLRAEGIKHLEDLATFIWTDFNAHDPGITILEVLCYALTDLGYRVNLPFEDLMAGESGNYKGLFFGAEESLSISPVTELDYRKLLIDVPGVRNAWLERITSGGKYGEIDVFLNYPFDFRDISPADANALTSDAELKALISNLSKTPKNIIQIRANSEALALTIVKKYGYYKKDYRTLSTDGKDLESILKNVNLWEDSIENKERIEKVKKYIESGGDGQSLAGFSPKQTIQIIREVDDNLLAKKIVLSKKTEAGKEKEQEKEQEENAKIQALLESLGLWIKSTLPTDIAKNNNRRDAILNYIRENGNIKKLEPEFTDTTIEQIVKKLDCAYLDRSGDEAIYPIFLNGLYKITLDLQDPSIAPTEQRAKRILDRVRKRLHENRNLCEDFVAFDFVESIKICLCLHLEIIPEADAEEVMAKALFDLQEFLTPTVKFQTLQQLLEKGLPGDQIYHGPLLQHGFLDDHEVATSDLRKEIFTSDLYTVLLAIPEIKSVRELKLKIGNDSEYSADWRYGLEENKKPVIDPCCSNLGVTQGVVTKTIKEKNIAPFLDYYNLVNLDIPDSEIKELPSPNGVFRPDLAEFTSIQYDFPRTYFLGSEVPPDKVGTARLAHIKQLKAYLSFFDRLLANYLQQLSRVRDMFAVQQVGNVDTIFFSTLAQIPGMSELMVQNPVITLQKIDYAQHGLLDLLKKEQQDKTLETNLVLGLKQKVKEYRAFAAEFIQTLMASLPEHLAKLNHQLYTQALIEQMIEEWLQKALTKLQVLKKAEFSDIDTLIERLKQLFGQILEGSLRQELTQYTSHLGDLRSIVEGEDNNQERREKILNHLIARFGAQFTDYTLELFQRSAITSTYDDFDAYLGDKTQHLANLPALLYNRAKAYNYKLFKTEIPAQPDVWNTTNVSGLQKKVYSLLGIEPKSASLMCDARYRVDKVKDNSKERRAFFIQIVEQNADGSIKQILLTSTQSYANNLADEYRNKVRERIETDGKNELSNSNDLSFNVEISAENSANYQVVYVPDSTILGFELRSEAKIKKDTDELLVHILDLVNPDQGEREGFHLVEHILLRPNDDKDEYLPAPKTCDPTHSPVDPYSFWITVVLPAGTRRFKDKDFQQYFEQIFLAETPAHIAVCFLWVDDRVWMKRFEDALEKWREAKAKCSPDECQVTEFAKDLIQILQEKPCPCCCFDRDQSQSRCMPVEG